MSIKEIMRDVRVRAYGFVLCLALMYGLCFTITDFYELPFGCVGDLAILVMQWGVVVFTLACVLLTMALSRYVFAVTFPLLAVLGAILAYYRVTSKVQLTSAMIELAMVNDVRTCGELVTWQLVVIVCIAALLSGALVYVRWRWVRFGRSWVAGLVVGVVGIGIVGSIYKLRYPVSQRIPFTLYSSMVDYICSRRMVAEERPEFAGDVTCGVDSMTVVVIIGESVRASNLGVNGYERATTPNLSKEKNLVSYADVRSMDGVTHLCVPYMLTRADSAHYDLMFEERSFIDLFKRAGYRTAWVANQEMVDSYAYFMHEADTLEYVNGGKASHVATTWLDEDLLPAYKGELGRGDARKLIILHTIGSHWFYDGHYTETYARWKPTTSSKVVSSNALEQMRNSYDNTILYSDNFWRKVIDGVRGENAIVFYLSDHGECMGEDGYFLHAREHEALLNPGSWVWYSDRFGERYGEKVMKLRENSAKRWNAAYLFHSVLDAGEIRGAECYEERYDVFR